MRNGDEKLKYGERALVESLADRLRPSEREQAMGAVLRALNKVQSAKDEICDLASLQSK